MNLTNASFFLHSELDFLGWGSFIAGLTHPVLGPDHLLAMLSVGIVSAQIGGTAIWTVPATFVGVMAVGGLVGLAGIPLPWLEVGIALSVVVLGLIIAVDQRLPFVAILTGVALFALFHGYAHGVEIPETSQPMDYIQGFMLGTAAIHLAGVGIGHWGQRLPRGNDILRFVGLIIATCGVYFLLR